MNGLPAQRRVSLPMNFKYSLIPVQFYYLLSSISIRCDAKLGPNRIAGRARNRVVAVGRTMNLTKTFLFFFFCTLSLGYASAQTHTATGSTSMSDREKVGLHGPVRTCMEESALPEGRIFSTTTEYSPDGRLLATRMRNPDGSEWVTTREYDSVGRLVRIVSGKLGERGRESVYTYDERGRLSAITNEDGRTDFRYDAQGLKTTIQTFDAETILSRRKAVSTVPEWDTVQRGFGIPMGGSVVTIYDENDRATQAEIQDARGQTVKRIIRTYNEDGQVSEDKPAWVNPEPLLLDQLPAEQRDQVNPVQMKALFSVLGGNEPGGTSYDYDSQHRLTSTHERMMFFEKTRTVAYNEHGEEAEERTTFAVNSRVPIGVPFSISEDGDIVPSERAAGTPSPPSPPLPAENLIRYDYQYDSHGNWTQQTANIADGGSSVRNRTLTYY